MSTTQTHTLKIIGLAATASLALAACSGSANNPVPESTGNASEGTTTSEITFWDPYPQHTEGSVWDTHVKACAPQGSTIVRSAAPQTDLFNQLTTAVREDAAPDVVFLDNPMMPEAVAAGLVATAEQAGLDTTGIDANLIGPGTVDGTTYGVPVGSNALGLYYNKTILEDAGIDPATLTSWDALNNALAAVTEKGNKGITFSGVVGEEGTFQFLPWFWGSGASLTDLSSENAVSAGQLLSDWIGQGYAPKSVVTDNQSNSWDLFLTGEYAFAENGSWFAAGAADANFEIGVIPIPSKDGGIASVPTGGEFAIAPVHQKDASNHFANAAAVISCLTKGEAAMETAENLGYLSAVKEVRDSQVSANELWTPWVALVEGAQGRTTELGVRYVTASAMLSEATQASFNALGDSAQVEEAFNAIQ